MKQRELFELNKITSVIQIKEAQSEGGAQGLLRNFVLTPSLADEFERIAIPQLTFESGIEGKGIFVVGNYGTGKSHVMSFLSIIAENDSMLALVKDEAWRKKLSSFAGKYAVVRDEANPGDETVSFYAIVAKTLERLGCEHGVGYKFPMVGVTNVKDPFLDFMAEFDAKRPGVGVLVVIDEILDFLRQRPDQDRVRDFNTMRALGELAQNTRLRIMMGVQQSLFENPQFAQHAELIGRIKARYNDLRISKEGVAQLIEQHLFAKNADQRARIRELLKGKADLYEVIGTDIDRFVALYPAHPAFIDEFQNVSVVERREILKVLSVEADKVLDDQVDPKAPRLITSDRYWQHIETDQSLRADPNVNRVIQNVGTIKKFIKDNFVAADDKPSAIRLVEALGVNRLTTPTINDPTGLTPLALKNSLLWWTPIPMEDPGLLVDAAKRLLKKTQEAANGQFIAESETTGQWYVDPLRDRDYEQEVNVQKPSKQEIQRYLNTLVASALELDPQQKVEDRSIWSYSLLWEDRKVDRPGWIFFGLPSERSTQKPPKDFYAFIMPSKRLGGKEDNLPNLADEAYLSLEGFPPAKLDIDSKLSETDPDSFLDVLRKFTAASERALIPQKGSKERIAFENIAKKHQKVLLDEFRDHYGDWISITHNGTKRTFREWVQHLDPSKLNFAMKAQFDAVMHALFAPHFEATYSEYPRFTVKVTEGTRAGMAESALEIIGGVGQRTAHGRAVLEALELYKDDAPTPDRSPWLKKLRNFMKTRGDSQVINHSELFEVRNEKAWWRGECVEAEWLHVVIAAGIEAGDLIVISDKGDRYDATMLAAFVQEVKSYERIKRIGKPSVANLDLWRKLFMIFGVNYALIANPRSQDEGIRQFQAAVQTRIKKLVDDEQAIKARMPFATDEQNAALQAKAKVFGAVKGALESDIAPLNTKAKMANLKWAEAEIEQLATRIRECNALAALPAFVSGSITELQALERYEAILVDRDQKFTSSLAQAKLELAKVYGQPDDLAASGESLRTTISDAVREAFRTYQSLYRKHLLDKEGDKRKQRLIASIPYKQLHRLKLVSQISPGKLDELVERIQLIQLGPGCTDADLLKSADSLCPKTKFDPRNLSDERPALEILDECEREVESLNKAWTDQLVKDLQDPQVKSTRSLLSQDAQQLLDGFLKERALPAEISDSLIKALNDSFRNLKKKTIKVRSFADSVAGVGSPVTADELRQRLEVWIKEQIGSDDPATVKFVLEE